MGVRAKGRHLKTSRYDCQWPLEEQGQALQVTPVEVKDGAIVLRPSDMAIGRFYSVEWQGREYLYRRVDETVLEMSVVVKVGERAWTEA